MKLNCEPMDQQLNDLLDAGMKEVGKSGRDTRISLSSDKPGEIEIEGGGGPKSYTLKPLKDLFVAGEDSPSVDPQDERYMPLFLVIEEQISRYYQEDPGLTDGSVGLTLDQLAMDPTNLPAGDALAQRVSVGLRLTLSLNDYSRAEVRAALRKIRKSVDRHSKIDGRWGYLEFLVEFFG